MKRSPKALTDLDRAVLELLQRKVRSKDGREMSIIEGLLGQDAAAALQGDDQAIKRLRAEYARACDRNADRVEADNEYASEWILTHFKFFDEAQRLGLPPPDILPHPAHVRITEEGPVIMGPTEAEERADWEYLKYQMRWFLDVLAELRRVEKLLPREGPNFLLGKVRAEIERVRRRIPKGWDWKEKIYTLGSSAEEIARHETEILKRIEQASPAERRKIDAHLASWRFPKQAHSSRASL